MRAAKAAEHGLLGVVVGAGEQTCDVVGGRRAAEPGLRVEDEVLAGLLAGPRRVGRGAIGLAQVERAGLLGAAERGAVGRDLVERAGLLGAAERGAIGRDLVERAGLLGAAE